MGKKVLVVGSGGREHAIAWALARSLQVEQVLIAPGNDGMEGGKLHCVPTVKVTQHATLRDLAAAERVAFTFVGPDDPLAQGIVDCFQQAGLHCFGPAAAAARIESSKAFAKALMQEVGVPTAAFGVFDDYNAARRYIERSDGPLVVKASGLAAGKGVVVCDDKAQALAALKAAMLDGRFGAAGRTVVIEERLRGVELSLFAISDGRHIRLLLPSRDHKALYNHDNGPNTGGMGAFTPVPDVSMAQAEALADRTVRPIIAALAERGTPFVGVLYTGLMLTAQGPYVLEYNARLGDPETQAVLPLLQTDLVDVVEAALEGRLDGVDLAWQQGAAVTVVLASGGYPGVYPTGLPIFGLETAAAMPGVLLFHAGTRRKDGRMYTAGGRVLNVTALGDSLAQAVERAYVAAERIHFPAMHYRQDIGRRWVQQARMTA